MEGLGLAVQLEHGILHHFMGAMFSHQTCLPVLRRVSDGFVTASNHDNIMQIVGWGTCGGKREVAEAAAAVVAAGEAAVVAEGSGETEAAAGGGVPVSVEDSGGGVFVI